MNQLSAVLIDLNQPQEGLKLARSSVRLRPEDPAAYANIARASMALKDHTTAVSAARTAISLQPNSFYLGMLSAALFSARQIPEARDAAMRCLASDPTELNALAIAALTSLAMADHAQAEKCAMMLLQHGPVEGFCLTMAATVFREIGRRAEGMRLLKTFVEREPNNPRAHEAMGLACWNRGDVPGARRYFREALRINPEMERVRQILRMHTKTRPQDMPEGWVQTRYVERYDAHGRKVRIILAETRRPPAN